MIKIFDFCYHKECYTCSFCKSNGVHYVSDGGQLWCQSCCCYYCGNPFYPEMKVFKIPKKLVDVQVHVCEICYNKLQFLICFTCGTKIDDPSKVKNHFTYLLLMYRICSKIILGYIIYFV